MLPSLIVSARETTKQLFSLKPVPLTKPQTQFSERAEVIGNVLFFAVGIIAPMYFTIIRDVFRKIRGINYKIMQLALWVFGRRIFMETCVSTALFKYKFFLCFFGNII